MVGLFYQLITVGVGVVLTPFLLLTLGVQLYGVWALLNTIGSYETLSDFGITTAIVAFVNRTKLSDEIDRIITTGTVLNIATTLIVVVALYILKPYLIRVIFRLPAELVAVTTVAYVLNLVALMVLVTSRSLAAILDALQRVDVRIAIEILGIICGAVLTWFSLARGYGLIGVIWSGIVIGCLRVVAFGFAIRQASPQLRPHFGVGRQKLAEIIRYGANTQGASLGLTLSDPLLKIFVGVGTTPANVGSLQIGSSVATVPNSLAFSMVANLFPAIAERHGNGDMLAVKQLASRYLAFVVFITFPTSTILWLASPELIRIWLHAPYPLIVLAIRMLTITYIFRALALIPWSVALGSGRPQDNSVAMILNLCVLVMGGVALLLISQFTYDAILFVYIFSYVASTAYLFWRMYRNVGNIFSKAEAWLLRGIIQVGIISAAAGGVYFFSRLVTTNAWSRLIVGAVILLASYGVALMLTIPSTEWQKLKNSLVQA